MTQELKERIARVFDDWCRAAKLRLHAGEMTAQEIRTVQAVLPAVKQAVLSFLPPQSVPEGWQLVPTKPTPAMFAAADEAMPGESPVEAHDNIWTAMLSASPLLDQQGGKDEGLGHTLIGMGYGDDNDAPKSESEREAALEEAAALFDALANNAHEQSHKTKSLPRQIMWERQAEIHAESAKHIRAFASSPPKPADELSNYAERTPITIRSSSVKPAVAEGVVERMKGIIRGWSIDIFADAIADRHINDLVSVLVTANLLRTDKEPS